ncbi:MAG: ABC transporter substrate-binding protein, partial [candidate division WS1 bacterium]|nr:ABC transporter substrate-binding protein [candidate division WS1 bacterium]
DPQRSILTGYASDFMTKYQKPADTFGGHAYDAFQVVVAAMEAAGDDPAKLRDAIEATQNFIGISGIFNMSPTDHNGLTKDAFEMVTVKNGTWAPAS